MVRTSFEFLAHLTRVYVQVQCPHRPAQGDGFTPRSVRMTAFVFSRKSKNRSFFLDRFLEKLRGADCSRKKNGDFFQKNFRGRRFFYFFLDRLLEKMGIFDFFLENVLEKKPPASFVLDRFLEQIRQNHGFFQIIFEFFLEKTHNM